MSSTPSVIKMPLNKYIKNGFMLFVHQFEYLMLNYCNIEVYLKTLMLGAINCN